MARCVKQRAPANLVARSDYRPFTRGRPRRRLLADRRVAPRPVSFSRSWRH